MITHSFHRAALYAASSILALAMGCSSETISDAGPITEYTVVLDAPGLSISAAVLELVGVDSLTAVDGEVISRRDGDVVRAIVLLRVPGRMSFGVSVPEAAGPPSGVVLEATDETHRVVDALAGVQLRIEP
jgi:hypothetical protein